MSPATLHDSRIFPMVKTTCARARRVSGAGLLISLTLLAATLRAQSPGEVPPWQKPAVSLETGLLWQVGNNTPLSYRLVPVQLSWRSAEAFGWQLPSSR